METGGRRVGQESRGAAVNLAGRYIDMASISSAGLGSGLDVNSIITQLMNVEKQPLVALDTKEATYQAKLSAFGGLKGAVSSLQTAALALKSSTLYASMTASSSSTSVATASANTAAAAGTYAIQVIDRAQAQSISSKAFASLTADVVTNAVDGKIKIELGTFTPAVVAPPAPASFVADPARTAVTIDIAANQSSLQEIRDKINDANAGVKANIVYVGSSGYKLTLTANDTGVKSSIKLTVMDTNDTVLTNNADLAQLSFDPTLAAGAGNEFDINAYAQDAHLKIDGLDIYRSTNTISDAITGVTLTAIAAGTSTLTVSRDTASVTTAFSSFVKAYNDTSKQLRDLTAYNATTGQGSLLTGDSGARGLQTALQGLITATRKSAASGFRQLSDLGVAMQRDGSLAFDSSKLTSALSSGGDVATMMTSTSNTDTGLATRMSSVLSGLLADNGLLASRTDGIQRSIEDIGDRRTALERRLLQIEKRYRTQFSSLDSLVASMQRTSQYLSQQLANLPATSSS